MRIRLITISHKIPNWLHEGYQEYAKRLPAFCQLELIELPAEKRLSSSNKQKILRQEEEKIISQIKPQHVLVTLDRQGKQITTEAFSNKIVTWGNASQNVDLVIGGPDGLGKAILGRSHFNWSLSLLTFPHTLVRLLLAEQIYRACSIIQNHPYHR